MAPLEKKMFMKTEYKDKNIGFVGDRVFKTELTLIVVTNKMWKWMTNSSVNDSIQLAAFYNDPKNQDSKYTEKLGTRKH